METEIETPHPSAEEIEIVLAGMRDGTNVFIRWLKEGAVDRQFARKLFWVIPVEDEGDGVLFEHEVVACGRTPGEAAAAAWAGACCDDTGDWYRDRHEWRNITEAEDRSVPREVPANWTFRLHAVPKPRSGHSRFRQYLGKPPRHTTSTARRCDLLPAQARAGNQSQRLACRSRPAQAYR